MTKEEMTLLFRVAIVISIFFSSAVVLMTVRNVWVYNRTMELNRFEGEEHVIRRYVDYDTMMMKFWVWDIEKLKLPRENQNDDSK